MTNNPVSYILSASHELLADLETPVSTFYKICGNKPYSFLLESVEGNEKLGRYSIIGTEPILLFTNANNETTLENKIENHKTKLEDNPFIALKNLLKNIDTVEDANDRFLGFVGYFGYENIRWIEHTTPGRYIPILRSKDGSFQPPCLLCSWKPSRPIPTT